MSLLKEVLEKNKLYINERKGEGRKIDSHAKKKALIFTCMDTRLVNLVEESMGFRQGDVKVLKNAGNSIRTACDDVIRSISLGTIMMGLEEVFVVGHKDCGMAKQDLEKIKEAMLYRGISEEIINSIDLEEWTGIISDEKENIIEVVNKIEKSPFIPLDVKVHGLSIDPYSGELEVIVDGNA
ncbi:beta-class carbonic anhydrase [Sporosalibacterium faouarense]|uniref:beta-class carbonic anhydrase n=1 Tax=Sporosalibacterium faouarense TaxID=516123 RepID=UPI00141C1E2A|nr:carbonic anhydrase [Sporosalibacterium faouarense]MTI49821.1 carbonic anhydrase [Bacillota bacterium]